MPTELTSVKKIFFNSSHQEEDTKITEDLCLFFAVLKDKVSLWHKEKIIPGDDRKATLNKNLDEADVAIHLLSNAYENEPGCIEIMNRSLQQNKKNIPVLVSAFPWELDDTLVQLKNEFMPHDLVPLNRQPFKNEIYTEIVKNVKKDVLGDETKLSFNSRGYYFMLAGVALVAGFFVAYFADDIFDSLAVTLLAFLMFVCAALFILRKIIFPTAVSTYKF